MERPAFPTTGGSNVGRAGVSLFGRLHRARWLDRVQVRARRPILGRARRGRVAVAWSDDLETRYREFLWTILRSALAGPGRIREALKRFADERTYLPADSPIGRFLIGLANEGSGPRHRHVALVAMNWLLALNMPHHYDSAAVAEGIGRAILFRYGLRAGPLRSRCGRDLDRGRPARVGREPGVVASLRGGRNGRERRLCYKAHAGNRRGGRGDPGSATGQPGSA